MIILAGLVGAFVLVELAAAAGLRILHSKTGVFYSPRDAPRLSPACREFLAQLVRAHGVGRVMQYSRDLGWEPVPNRRGEDGLQETNEQGIRSRREHPTDAPAGSLRIAAFGDCLTYGEGVPLEATWAARLERLDTRFEVLNFGVDGYGLDQCFLRHLDSLDRYRGQRVVLIGFVSSNVYKSLNVFRPFYAHDHDLKLTKPRFALRGEKLVRIDNPIRDLSGYEALLEDPARELQHLGTLDVYQQSCYTRGRFDALSSVRLAKIVAHEIRKLRRVRDRRGRFVPGSEALATTTAIFDAFCARVRDEGAVPIVLLIPTKQDLTAWRRHRAKPWVPLLAHFKAAGEFHVDVLDVLTEAETTKRDRDCFVGRHLTPAANAAIAAHLVEFIHRQGIAVPPAAEDVPRVQEAGAEPPSRLDGPRVTR